MPCAIFQRESELEGAASPYEGGPITALRGIETKESSEDFPGGTFPTSEGLPGGIAGFEGSGEPR